MIALVQFAATISAALYKFRLGWAFFVFFLAFSPRSLGVMVGNAQVITFTRLALPLLILTALFSATVQHTRRFYPLSKAFRGPALVLTLLVMHKVIATVATGGNIVFAIEDGYFSAVLFVIFYSITTERHFNGAVTALVASVAITIVLVGIEYTAHQPVHTAIANQAVLRDGQITIKIRDGLYRALGIFDGSLQLAEYLVYALAGVLFLRQKSRTRNMKLLTAMLVMGILLAEFATDSRGGLLTSMVVIALYFILKRWHRMSRTTRVAMLLLTTALVVVTTLQAYGIIVSLNASNLNGQLYRVESATERSTISRALQYFEIFQAVSQNPLFGFGLQSDFAGNLDAVRRIDNYYLRLLLEGGFIALGLFLVFMFSLVRGLLRQFDKMANREYAALWTFGLTLTSGFLFMKLFLSQPANNIYYYMFISGVFARLDQLRRQARLKP